LYEGACFKANNTDISWKQAELWETIDTHPERFSPNVICRPLYQEVVLPNLCYIGGGGELAYWFELKAFFEAIQVPFPMLMLRNSVVVSDTKAFDKLKKLGVGVSEMFLKKNHLINRKIREISNIEIDLGPQKKLLASQFATLHELAQQTDASFLGAVQAQERKQIKGLEHLEKRLLKAQKRKLADQVQRLAEAQNVLFPEGSLQERNQNFSEQYLRYGPDLIPALKSVQKPFESDFIVMVR